MKERKEEGKRKKGNRRRTGKGKEEEVSCAGLICDCRLNRRDKRSSEVSDSSSAKVMEVCCLCLHNGQYKRERKEKIERKYNPEKVKREDESYENYDYQSEEMKQCNCKYT
eukprot:TRINITY_DN28049_c0_g1_i1.p1 TRINITY_DN28049_c0_g1~~TRINITY_DN28049_c0_g1_i1.p1  ORF type:complete len:111 (+),score=26.55 TRINITY_DN28049_c0_g1_i1:68-400(+)